MSTIKNQNNEHQLNSVNNSSRTNTSIGSLQQQIGDNYRSDEFETEIDDNSTIKTTSTSYDLHNFLKTHFQKTLQQNRTFKPDKLQQIEIENSYLMGRILKNSTRKNQYPTDSKQFIRKPSNFLINRQKAQSKIDYENQILWSKIQKVKPTVRRN